LEGWAEEFPPEEVERPPDPSPFSERPGHHALDELRRSRMAEGAAGAVGDRRTDDRRLGRRDHDLGFPWDAGPEESGPGRLGLGSSGEDRPEGRGLVASLGEKPGRGEEGPNDRAEVGGSRSDVIEHHDGGPPIAGEATEESSEDFGDRKTSGDEAAVQTLQEPGRDVLDPLGLGDSDADERGGDRRALPIHRLEQPTGAETRDRTRAGTGGADHRGDPRRSAEGVRVSQPTGESGKLARAAVEDRGKPIGCEDRGMLRGVHETKIP
jgi:hypothetical protein